MASTSTSSCKEDPVSSFSSIEEENEVLLNLWQRAAFIDSGQGIPREKADSLRLRTAYLSAYHTKLRKAGWDSFGTELLLKDYMSQYAKVVDERDETKGMNNFCSTVDTLLAGRVKGQRNWKTTLTASAVREMPAFKALLQEADDYAKKLPTLKRGIPPYESPAPPSSAPPPATSTISTASQPAPQGPYQGAGLGTSNPPPKVPQKRGTFQYSNTPSTSSGSSSGLFSTTGSHSPTVEAASVGSREVEGLPMKKKSRGDEVMCEWEERGGEGQLNAFSTAKDEFVRQQQRKYPGRGGGGGASASNYGSSKKVLGTRRGVGGKFVPPVRREPGDEDGHTYSGEAEIRSRVLRGGEAGRAGETSSGLPPELEGNEKLRNIEPRMVEMILNEIMDHTAAVQWDDIAGLEFAKATIKEIVVWPMMRPDLFTGLRGPPKGILLFGPPGTGKTLIGKCIASQVKATFFSISASSLTSKWIGEGEKMVRALFAVARCYQPAVIFMDEIDSLLTQRSDTEHESSRRIKTEFLVQLDGATTSDSDRLLVIGATNRPQEIDEAARRRLVKRLYIPLPDMPARRQLVLNLMKQQPYELTEQEIDLVCTRTDGFSGADMASLCREAAYGPVREAAASIQHISVEEIRSVQFRDFEEALRVIRPSVSEKDLHLYTEWNMQFGCGGR